MDQVGATDDVGGGKGREARGKRDRSGEAFIFHAVRIERELLLWVDHGQTAIAFVGATSFDHGLSSVEALLGPAGIGSEGALLLSLSAQIEAAHPWRDRRPPAGR
jgi:hypothetical protein